MIEDIHVVFHNFQNIFPPTKANERSQPSSDIELSDEVW